MARARGTAPVVVGFLIAGSIAALLGLSSTLNPIDAILGRGAIVTVPDLEGRTQPVAEAEVRAAGLEPNVVTSFSLSVRRGSVIAQDPKTGSRVREGSTVDIVVSRGANRVEVTDVVGKPLAEVRPPFDEAGVTLEITEQVSETVPAGVIIAQDPGPGVVVTGRDTVRFVVSKGADPRAVPDVAGLPPVGAGFRLGQAGLVVGATTESFDPAVVEGAVIGTDPPAGTMVEKDRAMTVVVSGGPAPIPVPEVRNLPYQAASDTLRQAGLVPNLVVSSGGGSAVVIDQVPVPGTPLAPGLPVTLSLGPPSATTTTAPPATTVPPPPTPGVPTTVPGAPGG